MNYFKISATIAPTNPEAELGIEILLDNTCIFRSDHVSQEVKFEHEIPDDESDQGVMNHELSFVMFGKKEQHTTIDAQGNIVKDSCLTIKDVNFEEIDITHLLPTVAKYSHNFNGTGADTVEKFYDTMGCNGAVTVPFTTPIYLWLLEQM